MHVQATGGSDSGCGEHGARETRIQLRTPVPGQYASGQFTISETSPCRYTIDLYLAACQACPVGTDRPLYMPVCVPCPQNRYKDVLGRVATWDQPEACTACPAGTDTQSTTGATTCTSCPANTYTNYNVANPGCTACPAGTDTRGNLGSTSCTSCAAGWYSNSLTGGICTECPAGSQTLLSLVFHSGEGATDCQLCPQGQHSPISTTQCSPCGENEVTGDSSRMRVTGTGATTCLPKATCGDANGERPGSDPIDCLYDWSGLVYDASKSAAFCDGAVCDPAHYDQATCCGAPATCGDVDGAGAGSTGVSDVDCGAGFVARPASDATLCTSTSCDIAGTPADKAACCIAAAEPPPPPAAPPAVVDPTPPSTPPPPPPAAVDPTPPSPPSGNSQDTTTVPPPSLPMYKIGGGIATTKEIKFTDSPRVSAGSGMTCRLQPANSGVRYLCE